MDHRPEGNIPEGPIDGRDGPRGLRHLCLRPDGSEVSVGLSPHHGPRTLAGQCTLGVSGWNPRLPGRLERIEMAELSLGAHPGEVMMRSR